MGVKAMSTRIRLPAQLVCAMLCLSILTSQGGARAAEDPRQTPRAVTLLIHGMTWNPRKPTPIWGQWRTPAKGSPSWTGLLGALQQEGWRFGGFIRPRDADVRLPTCLDMTGTKVKPHEAT